MYRAAISSIFSELHRQNRLVAIEQPKFEAPKTKEMNRFLEQFNLNNVLIILDEMDTNLISFSSKYTSCRCCNC